MWLTAVLQRMSLQRTAARCTTLLTHVADRILGYYIVSVIYSFGGPYSICFGGQFTLSLTCGNANRLYIHNATHSSTHCNTLHHFATHCTYLRYIQCNALCNALHCTATRCNALQHTATHCKYIRYVHNNHLHATVTALLPPSPSDFASHCHLLPASPPPRLV